MEIIRDAPLGSAAYNNEFGRPAIYGYFRTLEYKEYGLSLLCWQGIGSIKEDQIKKGEPQPGDLVIVLGGPECL